MKFSCLLSFLSLLVGERLSAETKNEPARQVRFLTVGELPPFRQEIRDNVRYELEPPAGSIPPRELMLGFGGNESAATLLRLGQISAPLKVPSGSGPLVLSRRDAAKDATPWLRLTRPESGDFLVILIRDPKIATWERVRSLVLPEDAVSAPAGSVRLVNCSPVSVALVIGAEKLILEAGKVIRRPVPLGVEQPFEILLADSTNSLKRLHSGVILQNPGERSLVLVYRADGVAPRHPLKVAVQREAAPAILQKD